jgi:hypothetical protein
MNTGRFEWDQWGTFGCQCQRAPELWCQSHLGCEQLNLLHDVNAHQPACRSSAQATSKASLSLGTPCKDAGCITSKASEQWPLESAAQGETTEHHCPLLWGGVRVYRAPHTQTRIWRSSRCSIGSTYPPPIGCKGRYSMENDCSFCFLYIGFQRLLARDQGQKLVCNAVRRGWLICRVMVQNKDN